MLRFNALGPIVVLHDGQPVDLGPRKQKSLFLAVRIASVGHVVPTDSIVQAVWGEDASPTARRSVQTYVSNRRRLLDDGTRDVLAGTTDGYMLSDDDISVDWVEFESVPDEGSVEACQPALELWSGDPFEDVENDWARPLIAAWDGRRLTVLETWADLMTEQRRPAEVVPYLEQAVACHPIRESLWARLMTCCAAAG